MSVNPAGAIPAFDLSDRLRKAREVSGLDQSQLADAMGVSRGTVSNAERGTRASVTRLETWRERNAA